MIDFPTETLTQIWCGFYKISSNYLNQLILSVLNNNNISAPSYTMYSSSVSSEISSSSVMKMSTSSDSSSSISSKDSSASEIEFQASPSKSWKRRRSTSLIEWKHAPSVKNTHLHHESKNLNIIPSDHLHPTRAATNYLDHNPITIYNDIKNSRFPTSASTSQLPTSASTPEFPRSTTISRSNSIRTNCSCFSCTQPGS